MNLNAARNSPVLADDRFLDAPEPRSRIDLQRYWSVILRRKWVIAAIAAISIAAGVAASLVMTPIYRASTTLQIEREAVQVVEEGNVSPSDQVYNAQEFYQTQYGLLKSRSLALRVVRQLSLVRNPRFMGKPTESEPAAARHLSARARREVQEKQAVAILLANFRVEPMINSRLVTISYESADPVLAERIANSLADNFIASNLERRFEASAYARRFLEDRLQQLRSRLEVAERELVAYAQREQLINVPGSNSEQNGGEGRPLTTSRLVDINNALSAATSARSQAEQRLRAAASSRQIPEALADPTMQALQQRRGQISAEYQRNLQLYAPEYPLVRQLKAQLDETDRQIAAETAAVRASLTAQYRAALAHEREMQGEVSRLKESVLDIGRRSVGYNILRRELDTSRTLYEGLLQRYREIGIAGAVGANNVSVVDRAEVPTNPVRPNPPLNVALAFVAGLALGLLVALGLEYLDNSVRTPEDVEAKLRLPLLGTVPALKRGEAPAEALRNPRSNLAEAYHSARTSIQFSSRDGVPKSLLITSSKANEGKTTSAIALAREFAHLGQSVLLIDGDLRAPSLHRELGAANAQGVSNYLIGNADLDSLVQVTGEPNLFLLSSGPLPPNPGELLGGARLQALVLEGVNRYDLIVVDGPPVMGLADAPLWGAVTAGTLFVVEAGRTRRTLVTSSVARLRRANSQIVGVLLSKFNLKRTGYGRDYGDAYGYGYGASTKEATL